MKQSHLTPNQAVSLEPAQVTIASGPVSRRRFMSLFTAGAASMALQACGGGGETVASAVPAVPSTPSQPSAALSLGTVPTLTFVQGVPSSISAAQWISGADPAAVMLSLNSVALPSGVSYNGATKSFDYDGVGAPAVAEGLVLTAVGG